MHELSPYFDLLSTFNNQNAVAIDLAHNVFLVGAVLARKPERVLELGVGSGYVTKSLLHALRFNRKGKLTSVDNWFDWNGAEPPFAVGLRSAGVSMVVSGEEEFVRSAPDDAYDFLVSDADHFRSGNWLDQHLRIVRHDGFLFFHDTNQPRTFPSLAGIEGQIRTRLAAFSFQGKQPARRTLPARLAFRHQPEGVAMIYLGFPYGSTFGWGVLGKEIILAMAKLTDVRVIAPPNIDQRLNDEFERYHMRRLLLHPKDIGSSLNGKLPTDSPVLQAAVGHSLEPFVPGLAAPADIGYAVFEEDTLPQAIVNQARRNFRHIATASGYCADVLRRSGLSEVSIIPHGVDTALFCPRVEPRAFLKDRFLIFSGGKFELRKGQDIVIRAYKVLQDRHKDVMLVNSWHNSWPKHRDTMAASTLIRYFPPKDDDHQAWVNALLGAHGIDVERVITVGPRDHRLLPELYHATDMGIFPNRAEGGNNMVLMEYLACGKPALAAFNTGHKEILRRQNAVLIESHRPMPIRNGPDLTTTWSDPSLEETIEKLEWCYQNRGQLHSLAMQAAADMGAFSWQRLAENLIRCQSNGPQSIQMNP